MFVVTVVLSIITRTRSIIAFHFNYIDCRSTLVAVPRCTTTRSGVTTLQRRCSTRLTTTRRRFGRGCRTFLGRCAACTPTVLHGHRTRLRSLLAHGRAFHSSTAQLLRTTRSRLLTPICSGLHAIVTGVTTSCSLTFIVGASSRTVPFIGLSVTCGVAGTIVSQLSGP